MALEPRLILDVAGRSLEGWVRINVERAIENGTISFGMISSRSWPGLGEGWWLEPGDRCTLRVNDEVVCTGWLDYVEPGHSHEEHAIEVSGRGLTCDLVDCSYVGPPWQWKRVTAQQIIEDVCKQFDIKVEVETDLGEPLDFQIQQGESCWEAIDRICSLRQVLSYETPDGSLLITRGSEEMCDHHLIRGSNSGNITNARATLDERDRFSHYIVKGQQKAKKGDEKQAAQSLGTIEDDGVKRYRPKLLVQSAETNNGDALGRAKWEMQNRWGKSRKAEISVAGWLMPNGKTWPINRLCELHDPWLGLDHKPLSITAATMAIGENGLRTHLTLQPPESLIPEPPSADKTPSAKKKGGAGEPAMWERVRADWTKGEARRKESTQ